MTSRQIMPPIESRVVSRDDIELGRVKEVDGACFKVDAPLARDFWLGVDTIENIEGNVVRLRMNNLAVDEFQESPPKHGGVHRHN